MGSLIRNRPSRYEGTAVASGHAHSPRRLVRHGGRTGSGRFVAGEVLIREKPRPESNRRGDSICCRLGVLSIPLSARGARARAGDAVESHGQRKSTTERALLSEWISKALIRAIWVGVRGLEPRTSSLSGTHGPQVRESNYSLTWGFLFVGVRGCPQSDARSDARVTHGRMLGESIPRDEATAEHRMRSFRWASRPGMLLEERL